MSVWPTALARTVPPALLPVLKIAHGLSFSVLPNPTCCLTF
jgi:hypothetical protein